MPLYVFVSEVFLFLHTHAGPHPLRFCLSESYPILRRNEVHILHLSPRLIFNNRNENSRAIPKKNE